jgi:hypothetical protein
MNTDGGIPGLKIETGGTQLIGWGLAVYVAHSRPSGTPCRLAAKGITSVPV